MTPVESRLGWLAYPIGLSVVTIIVGGIWVTDRFADREIAREDAGAFHRVPTPTP